MHYCNVRLQVIEFPAPHGWYPFSGRLFGGSLHMYLYQKSLNNLWATVAQQVVLLLQRFQFDLRLLLFLSMIPR